VAATVTDVLPRFSVELIEALVDQGGAHLAKQVPGLQVVARCDCGDDFCSSFYVAPRPDGSWGPGHRNVVVEDAKGMVVLDVVDDVITYVEVLDRPDVASLLRTRAT
jgi:hypothetical protein